MRLPINTAILILISFFSAILFVNTIGGSFVYDDFKIIVENSFVKEWQNLPKVFKKDYFSLSGEMSYRPLVTISYFVDYAICQENPLGFHITNLVLHTLNSILFFLFLRAVLSNSKIIFLSLLFFVTHPVLVETVNAIGYREDLLTATFLLLSFIFFIKSDSLFYQEKSQTTRSAVYYTISLISYLCALFSKEMAITLPLLLILFTVFFRQQPWYSFTRRCKGIYTGYLALSLFYLFIRFVVFSNPASPSAYQPGGFWINTFTMIKILASYIKLSFFPLRLNADYVVPLVAHPWEASSILAATFLSSIFIILAIVCKTRNIFVFWMSWFFITLLPVMNIIPIDNIMAERYLYIPVMGFCVAKGILIYRITDRTLSPRAIPLRRIVQRVLVILMIGGYGFTIIWKNGNWRDELTLWKKTIADSPNSYRAHSNLGSVYLERGLIERAHREYQIAAALNPNDANVHTNLGNVHTKEGQINKAFQEYNTAIRMDHNYAQPHNNLGNIYFHQGAPDKARIEYEEAIRIQPDYAPAYNGLGNIYNNEGDLDRAREEFKKALAHDSTYIPALISLGVNYAKRGQFNEAIIEFKKALALDADQLQGHYNLGLAYEKLGKHREAIDQYHAVIRLDPNNPNAHYALGRLYQAIGLTDNAIEAFQKTIFLSPDMTDSYKNLVFLYLNNKNERKMANHYLKELLKRDPAQAQKEDIKQVMNRLR